MGDKVAIPLFLSENELQNQAKNVGWRTGLKDISGSIFRTPTNSKEFPNVFQNTFKRNTTKQTPFVYTAKPKTNPKPSHTPLSIIAPSEEEDLPYGPTTP